MSREAVAVRSLAGGQRAPGARHHFVGSTYGPQGITVAVRVGFDDSRELGERETGGRAALPIFQDIMLRIYREQRVGAAPHFPRQIEDGIDRYIQSTLSVPQPDPSAPAAGIMTAAAPEATPVRATIIVEQAAGAAFAWPRPARMETEKAVAVESPTALPTPAPQSSGAPPREQR